MNVLEINVLVLAYLGDTVYESYIREHLIRQNINRKVNNLHKLAIQYSKAQAQATIIHELMDELTEEEIDYCLQKLRTLLPVLRRYVRR